MLILYYMNNLIDRSLLYDLVMFKREQRPPHSTKFCIYSMNYFASHLTFT